jgi:glucosamine--fructose-6-phosphate aminotransferase (isomerizing)
MCGITAYLGKNSCFDYLLNSLKMLQNRGYDSAGIATILDNNIKLIKYASDSESAINKLQKNKLSKSGNIGIAHTRWATHGPKTDLNSHPHLDYTERFALVHNGIIENYSVLKKSLIQNGVIFKSDTDTEVIVNLISYNFKNTNNLELSIQQATEKMTGTWGFVLIDRKTPNQIFLTRHGSPLLIGKSEDNLIVTSEISGFCNYINNYTVVKNNDLINIKFEDDKFIMNKINQYVFTQLENKEVRLTPKPYEFWTLKEIMEQPQSIMRALNYAARIKDDYNVNLGGLNSMKDELLEVNNLIILGCGTSLHAALIGKVFMDELENFDNVHVFDGAEFSKKCIPRKGKTALLLLSQSGETQDLHRCIKIGRDYDLIIMSVVNVVDSMIAREADCGVYLNAGREVAVASTKAFTSQLVVLNLIAIWFSQNFIKHSMVCKKMINDLRNLSSDVQDTIKLCQNNNMISNLSKQIIESKHKTMFVLGKGQFKEIAREAALKIKEIAYIHAEGYSGSALKHGPFALIEDNMPIIFVAPNDETYSKMLNSAEEVKARNAHTIFITDHPTENSKKLDQIIRIPSNKTFSGLLSIVVLQMLAYYLSVNQGINPDFPKNLAKVVTVE